MSTTVELLNDAGDVLATVQGREHGGGVRINGDAVRDEWLHLVRAARLTDQDGKAVEVEFVC
jgi:hypothetical protein